MNHYYQTIVDSDVSAGRAEHLGQIALEWMADTLIIDDKPAGCVPPADRPGFGPGPDWQSAIVELDDTFLSHPINGVHTRIGRQLFDAGAYTPTPVCPHCDAYVAADAPAASDWKDACRQWVAGDDQAALSCPACGQSSPLIAWHHTPPIGFGRLGIVFWNWPSLNREFISQLADILGDPLMLVEGKRDRPLGRRR